MNKEQPIKGWVKASETLNLPTDDKKVICLYSPKGLNFSCELKFADRRELSFLAKECNLFDVYWLDTTPIQSGEERLFTLPQGLDIFRAGAGYALNQFKEPNAKEYFKEKFGVLLSSEQKVNKSEK